VLEDATNAAALDSDDRASVAANTEIKLGVYFDGRDKVRFFVNGVNVASVDVSDLDNTKDYCVILGFKTGTGNARSIALDWIRYAFGNHPS